MNVKLVRRSALSLAVSCVCLGAVLGRPSAAPSSEVSDVMNDLAFSFRGMQSGLEERLVDDVAGGAAALAQAALSLGRLETGDDAFTAASRSSARRLALLADEVAELSRVGRTEGALQAFAELRGTCVACHVRLREDDRGRVLFPARRTTVAGTVRLTDLDGRPVVDRSHVVVFLESDAPTDYRPRRDPPQISQEGRQFAPQLLAVVRGTTVRFPNDDSVFHNVFSLSKVRPFDLGIYRQGEAREVRFDQPGLVKVYCNIHPEMTASIVVLATPWYARCAEDGTFVIDDVPPGRYRLRAWTELGGDTTQEIDLEAGQLSRYALELHDTGTPSPHRNKFGREYPSKY